VSGWLRSLADLVESVSHRTGSITFGLDQRPLLHGVDQLSHAVSGHSRY
jgi:hypothetical protein